MAQVCVTFCAGYSVPHHAETRIPDGPHIFRRNRFPEAGPAGARIEFGRRTEQRIAATDTAVEPVVVQIPIFSAERNFSIGAARDVELSGRKLLAPLVIAFDNSR